jgi:DNA-binding transcriptional regulator LsrR (DeoR family)
MNKEQFSQRAYWMRKQYREGLTQKQIAEYWNCSTATVSRNVDDLSRFARARKITALGEVIAETSNSGLCIE